MQTTKSKRWRQVSILIALASLVCLILVVCLPVAWLLLPTSIAKALAYAQSPPQYPGSSLIATQDDGGSAASSRTYIYSSSDNIGIVLSRMNAAMPGFVPSPLDSTVFVNSRCDKTIVGKVIVYLTQGPHLRDIWPCVFVGIRSDAKDATASVIDITVSWPTN